MRPVHLCIYASVYKNKNGGKTSKASLGHQASLIPYLRTLFTYFNNVNI